MNFMKPAIVFLSIFFLSVVISCTTQRNVGGRLEYTEKGKLQNDTPVFNASIFTPKKPKVPRKKDTVYNNTIQVVKVLDTAALIAWFKKMQLEESADNSTQVYNTNLVMILHQYREALDQNKTLLTALSNARQNKDKAETKVEVAEKALYDVPTYMYCILVLSIVLIVIRQQYLKTKLENKINALRASH